jgi:hypothetical protein
MLDAFVVEYPPTDLLVAAYLGLKPKTKDGRAPKVSMREAVRMNSQALAEMPARKNVRTLDQMPAFLRTPEQLAMIEGMKKEWKSSV